MEKNFVSKIDYSVKLNNFEGPLDLLLHLIKEAKLDIKDIFVSEVTEQYLVYMEGLSTIDMEKASDFLDVASTLLEIKSRMLLPTIDDEDEEFEDPAKKLIRQLEEYKVFKDAGEKLKNIESVDRFFKEPDENATEVKIVLKDMNLEGLLGAFTKLLAKVNERTIFEDKIREIPKDVYTVSDRMEMLKNKLYEKMQVNFFDLFNEFVTRSEVIATFQAILELLKLQFIFVTQRGVYEDIEIKLNENRGDELGEISEYN